MRGWEACFYLIWCNTFVASNHNLKYLILWYTLHACNIWSIGQVWILPIKLDLITARKDYEIKVDNIYRDLCHGIVLWIRDTNIWLLSKIWLNFGSRLIVTVFLKITKVDIIPILNSLLIHITILKTPVYMEKWCLLYKILVSCSPMKTDDVNWI